MGRRGEPTSIDARQRRARSPARGYSPAVLKKTAADFREFLIKQNALALAVGVIIGAAIGKVVSGIVDDVFMPIIGALLPGGDWRALQIVLTHNADGTAANAIKYGDLLGRTVDFFIVAIVIFIVVKALMRPKKGPPTTKPCPHCLETIPIAATRCRACTSELGAPGLTPV